MFKNGFLKAFAALLMMIPGLGLAQAPSPASVDVAPASLLSAFAAYTDLRLQAVQQSLEILASTGEARSANWKKMEPLLRGYQQSDGGLVVWFVRPDGTYYTVDKGLMGVKLNDRAYFPDLMSGKTVMGALVISKSTGQRSAVIAVPMKKGGRLVGAIGVSLFLDKFSGQVASALDLGPGISFFAMDPNGLTTLHKQTDRHFLDPLRVGSDSLKTAADEILSNPAGVRTYEFDNAAKRAFYRTSPLTQWKFVITFGEAGTK